MQLLSWDLINISLKNRTSTICWGASGESPGSQAFSPPKEPFLLPGSFSLPCSRAGPLPVEFRIHLIWIPILNALKFYFSTLWQTNDHSTSTLVACKSSYRVGNFFHRLKSRAQASLACAKVSEPPGPGLEPPRAARGMSWLGTGWDRTP